MSSTNSDRLLLFFFQFKSLLFLFLFWLSWLGLPKLYWIKMAQVDTLVPDLRGNSFCFSPLSMLAVGLSDMAFYYVEVVSLYEHFLKTFFLIINECRILLKAFSASTEIIIWFLFFSLLMCCITLIDKQILKNLCIPGINSTW